MTSPILDSLPAIHTTLIGFGGAFFSAFALYAYQRVRETKDELDKVWREVQNFSTPTIYIGTQADLFLENGQLDWEGKAKSILHDARSVDPRPQPDERITSSCRSLCCVLYYVFVSYPFPGRSMVRVDGIVDRIENDKNAQFDDKRLREIERRISYLRWCWETGNRSILKLAQECTEAEQRLALRQQRELFEAQIGEMQLESDEERERIWRTFHLPRVARSFDYRAIVADYFGMVMAYDKNVLPVVRESMRAHELFNERFQVKKMSLAMIGITVFILFFGVFLPPVMQSANSDFGLEWWPTAEYALLAATATPYFLVCWWLCRKLQPSSFR